MDVTYSRCAGLDVHKKTVVACCIIPGRHSKEERQIRTFSTVSQDLLALSDWLSTHEITHVAMESTGEYWKPVYNLLEANFTVLVVNAQHIKTVPGRKTDIKDAEWLAELLQHGLLRGSFIPPLPQRDLRDLTRQRTNLVREKATVINRLQKVLEWANLKLASVVSDISGVSARQILAALVEGQQDPEALADLAKGRLRQKREQLVAALQGNVREHHCFLLASHLTHIDFLDEQIALFDLQIVKQLQTASSETSVTPESLALEEKDQALPALVWQEAVTLLDAIPGIGRQTAELIIAEIGTDMSRFPSAGHLARWARLCPGNYESAGKRTSGRTGPGNRWLRSALVQAAQAAVHCRDTYFGGLYHRLVFRRGKNRALVAVAHHLLTAIYHMLQKHEPFRDLGANYWDERQKTSLVRRMCRRIHQLGYQVSLEPVAFLKG